MNVLIVDDVDQIRKFIKTVLQNIEEVKEIYEASTPMECINIVSSHSPDTVFLDIDLDGKTSGLDVARTILAFSPAIQIVFITAHSQYAHSAFDLDVTDYLVKPFDDERLLRALFKVKKRAKQKAPLKIPVKIGANISFLDYKNILFFEKVGKKVLIHTYNEILETYDTLNNLSKLLPDTFIRAHQSYIINIEKVRGLIPNNAVSYTVQFDQSEKTALLVRSKYRELCDLLYRT